MKLSQVASLISYSCPLDTKVTGFCIDTRIIQPGNVFIALIGTQFNGHDFIKEAVTKGALAVICERPCKDLAVPHWVVDSSLKALTILATEHRKIMQGPVIALTGSNGKTTVKSMIANILPSPSHATQGNLNNHIGAPLSVLQLQDFHTHAVFELGASHSKEIANTASIVQPHVSLVNNIAPAHIEGFGSLEGVAQAKGEIYQALSPEGTAIVNADDSFAHFWDELLIEKKVLYFSSTRALDIYAANIEMNATGCMQFTLHCPDGQEQIVLKVPGMHNVQNALAAAACCFAVGIAIPTIAAGLNQFTGVAGRLASYTGKKESQIIDDTYNANLRSTLAALEVLAKRPGKRIFIFGDMAELGEWKELHHQEVGLAAKKLNIDKIMTYGTASAATALAFGEAASHYSCQDALVEAVLHDLDAKTTVLVKGSRSSAMEKVVQKLLK